MNEHSSGHDANNLLRLSNEVSRIASDLARLSTEPTKFEQRAGTTNKTDVTAEDVVAVISARRLRSRYLPYDLFADPAWDMMLNLFLAELTGQPMAVSRLTHSAEVPATTALRWMNTMIERGIFRRRSDPFDKRRFFIELSADASKAMREYFSERGQIALKVR